MSMWNMFMPWREKKDHYSFAEIADRWRLSTQDLGYFAERGLLEVQTWLSDVLLSQYALKKIEGGTFAAVQTRIVSETGYFVIDPDELRKVFRALQSAEVRKFASPNGQDLYSIPFNAVGPSIGIGALEISLQERDRFEIENNLKPRASNVNKTGLSSPSIGRPSVKQLIIEHFIKRAAHGEIKPTLYAEARDIHVLVQDKLGNAQTPAFKTVVNNLRPYFAAHKGEEHP